jgi:predicted transcriptional regulator
LPDAPAAAGVGILSVLAGLAYLVWPTLKGAAFGLFSRVQGPALLKHPVRAEIVQRIEAHPGIHYQALVREMGIGKGNVEHHLRKLRDSGLVVAHATAGYTCLFPARSDRRLMAAAPALKSDGARAILMAIRGSPGLSALQVSQATGLSPGTVNRHLQKLGEAGLVNALRAGRSLHLQTTALADQALAAAA